MSQPSGPVPPGPELPQQPRPQPPEYRPVHHPVTAHLYGATAQPRPEHLPPVSKKMAGWALGLSIVPCCGGITTLVGLGLAIAVLVQSRDGRDHGKGLAIAALVISSLWIVIGVIAVLAGAFEGLTDDAERDASGRVTERDTISVLRLREGDCFDQPSLAEETEGDATSDTSEVEVVPCTDPHEYEVYLAFDLDLPAYPGEERTAGMAGRRCMREFTDFVGVPYGKSALEPYVFYPQERAWSLLDDRGVVCLVGEPGQQTTGTLEGSRR